jgi:hypothetical protein
MDFPAPNHGWAGGAIMSTCGPGSGPYDQMLFSGGVWANSGNLGTNVIYYVPVIQPEYVTIYAMAWSNSTTVSGNIDAGVYDINGNLLCNTGSIAQTTVSVVQAAAVTSSTAIVPGTYFLAMMQDNATGLVFRSPGISNQFGRTCGVQMQSAGAFGLPATATFANPTQGQYPIISACINTVVF